MNLSRLVLPELEESLGFWEDTCLIASLQKKAQKTNDLNLKRISKLFGDFSVLQEIDHEKLRVALGNKILFDNSKYLPGVPVDFNYATQIEHARSAHLNVEASLFYPYMLSQWVRTKKVYRIEDWNLIPSIAPKDGNYLHLLPCDAFVISFLNPIEIGFEASTLIKRYKSCIVARTGNLIDTFWIPDEIETKSLKPTGRKLIKEAIRSKNVKNKLFTRLETYASSTSLFNDPPFFTNISFDISTGLCFQTRAQRPDFVGVNVFCDLYHKNLIMLEEYNGRFTETLDFWVTTKSDKLKDSIRFHRFFLELLNGFCYMISEIKPKLLSASEISDKQSAVQPSRNFVWNEIPITKVDYLEENLSLTSPLRISYGSGEKSPHMRRGHWRNIVKVDGSSHRIWIDQVMVRADKLDKEELKGNVVIVREKRIRT